jgi:EAL domain-containing protein (putative c-di-GMP-specific phosphodiesterase class I)
MDSFNIKVQNDKIVNVTDTVIHIFHGVSNNNDISLFIDESPDLEQLAMGQELFLDFLRQLCEKFNYKPNRITIEFRRTRRTNDGI